MLGIQNRMIVYKKDLTALAENVSLSVSHGERLALIGEDAAENPRSCVRSLATISSTPTQR